MPTPVFSDVPLKGLRQVALRFLSADGTKSAPIFAPAPQMLEIDEDTTVKKQPGADAYYDQSSTTHGAKAKLKWGGLLLSLLAQMSGSDYVETGVTPNRQHRLKRKTSDNAPEFEIEGVVRYVGSQFIAGDYHFVGYRCKLLKFPKLSNKTDDYCDFEGEVDLLPRASDGEFYDMVLNETAVDVASTADNTAPTVTPVPAKAATGSTATVVTLTFNKVIQFVSSKFKLYSGTTTLVDIGCTAAIDVTGKIVTLTPGSAFATGAYTWAANGILDQAGNSVTDSGTFTHT